jgi:biopolymer transport protein TolR
MPTLISRGRGRRTINEINMVPFIDVMLVLLIIFMVTAPLITPSVINLPSAAKAARQPDKIIQVVINQDASINLKNPQTETASMRVTIDTVAQEVKKIQSGVPNSAVLISADKDMKYETVVSVMSKLQTAGVERVGLSVQLAK